MNKSTLTSLARAVKNIDASLWSIRRGSPEYDVLSDSRQSLVKIIFMNGFELQENTYRLIKSKENRGNKTVIVGNKVVEYWYNDDFQGEI